MRIHVGVCGIGFGHSSRSLHVVKKLLEHGYEVSVSTYGEAVNFFLRHGIPVNRVTSVKYGVAENGSVSVKRTLAENILLPLTLASQVLEEYNLIGEETDLVISDTRASTLLAAKMKRKPVILILNQFNISLETEKHKKIARILEPLVQAPAKVWEVADALAIPDLPPPYTISLRTLNLPEKLKDKTFYVGPLSPKPPAVDREEVRERLGIEEDELVLLAHISGPRKEREELIKKLTELAKKLDKGRRFIVTSGNPDGREIKREGNIIIFDWYENIHELFSACDLVISRAGLSVIHTCILHGRRMLLIPIPQHGEQVGNAYRVQQLGLGKTLEESKLSEETFREAINELENEAEEFGKNILEVKRLAESLEGVDKVLEILHKLLKAI
ncbi:MAG TPA: hypothetical protein EYH45_03265 [Candidatus Caldiarchaeum subterraneum]|uniref:Glycosyl transferase family 28 C-terminal domain-containing protein n=1 Tax=Caldiarchaeum subterraneum TaxID=311458 RepID=A0A832ZVR3_CALS0|nr:hypothetical protein [Candidatus Caldarchaeum subterraneum]